MKRITAPLVALLIVALLALPAWAITPLPDPALYATQAQQAFRNHIDPTYRTMLFGETGSVTAISGVLGAIDPGWPSNAVLTLDTADPSTTNTCTIDGLVFEFLTAGGTVANNANIGVVRGVNKQTTLTKFIQAINGTATANGLLKPSGGQCLFNNTTKNWYASDEGGTVMQIRSALTPGGRIVNRSDTAVVSETFTNAADIWDVGSGNAVNSGKYPTEVQYMRAQIVVTASHITFGSIRFTFANQLGVNQFSAIQRVTWQVTSSAGIHKYPVADAVTIEGGDAVYTLDGGGAPEAVAGDTITIEVAAGINVS